MRPSDQILDKLRQRKVIAGIERGDMYIADFVAANASSGKLLIGYDSRLAQPTASLVEHFCLREFEAEVRPHMTTAKAHPDVGAISVVISRRVSRRNIEDSTKMHCIVAGTTFLDAELGNTWNVVSADGQPVLERNVSDDIDEIIAERRRRMAVKGSTLTFASVLGSGLPSASPGDRVKVWLSNSIEEGEILAIREGDADVAVENFGTITLPRLALIEITAKGAESMRRERQALEDYYTKVFGAEYAQSLTRDMIGPEQPIRA